MARRIKSLHHNLGDKNVIFHREHRAKKNRTPNGRYQKKLRADKRREIEELQLKELDNELQTQKPNFTE